LDAQPNSRTNFSFAGGLGAFTLDDSVPQDGDAYVSSKSFSVSAGTYTVTESLPVGWLLGNIGCSPPVGTTADLANNRVVINAAAGSTITCTFTTQQAGEIVAGAYNDRNRNQVRNSNEPWLTGWQMQLHSERTQEVITKETNAEGRATFGNLLPGNYTVCEVLRTGWSSVTPGSLSPIYGQPCYSVTVTPGQAVWARFGNSVGAHAAASSGVVAAAADDIIVCALPSTDDQGLPIEPERDPWEEQEAAAGFTVFLPLVVR
jgi:hypothetical protein